MKIILRADVEDLGNKGTILDVADGYARNYLIPKGYALVATRGAVKQAAAMARARDIAVARALEEAKEAATKLGGLTIRIAAKAGEGGKLFGSVGQAEIAKAASAQSGFEIDRKNVELDQPIKEAGTFKVPVKIHPEVGCEIEVEVAGG